MLASKNIVIEEGRQVTVIPNDMCVASECVDNSNVVG